MLDPLIEGVLIEALEEYSADGEATFAAAPFVSWIIKNRPLLARDMDEAELTRAAGELMPRALRRAARG